MKRRDLAYAAAAVFVVLCCAKPASLWEFDEVLFAHSVRHYDPVAHYPPPPGYPVFIFVANIVRLFMPSSFAALVAMSIVASTAGFILLALAFARMTDATAGIAGALIFYLSPAMLVHSTLALSEPGAIALLAAALFFAPASPALFGAFAALSVGWRPQMCLLVVPLLFAEILIPRRGQPRTDGVRWKTLLVFTIVCLAWLIPLAASVGGIDRLIQYEASQAQYVAEHDASISRTAWKPAAIAIHFLSHPWGPRVMSVPLFLAAAVGAWRLRRSRAVVPLAIASVVYIAIALWVMDPADGVRYSIPFLIVIALAAAEGAMAITNRFGVVVTRYEMVIVFAVGSIMYVSSFVAQRSSTPSPPVLAAAAIPRNAAVGYELSLWPHATYLLHDRPVDRINVSMQRLFDTPRVPLYAYVDGISRLRGARTYAWENSDAYWNLTRNLYRIVSIAPLGPERRFKIIRGVHLLEREDPTESFRWIDADAAITAPRATGIHLLLVLPRSSPYADNRVTVLADGRVVGRAILERGKPLLVWLPFPQRASVVEFRAERSFSTPRDPRRLAFALIDMRFDLGS